jgi:hydroxyacyl-ACP dehydratase HTD2-like protein with hotdog domain
MQTVCYEDAALGDRLPLLKRGPLTTAHLMRWSAAIENWHKIHYDADFTREHEKLPGLLINGTLKQQFIIQLLKQFAGRTGWVWKTKFEFRAPNFVGETLEVWAEVTGLSRAQAFGLVELRLGILNEAGKESTPGVATVALPYRGGAPVPYPFQPPS